MNTNDAKALIDAHVHRQAPSNGEPWEALPELPSAGELMAAQTDHLPENYIDHVWTTKKEYLATQYALLRHEAVEGLRFSVNKFRLVPEMSDDQNVQVYTKVRIQGYLMTRTGPMCRVQFSTQRAQRRIQWSQSKRLTQGTLVALSRDDFKTSCIVGTVGQRPITGGLDQTPPVVDITWALTEESIIDPGEELVMLESRNGYFEACRHALVGLQLAAREPSAFDSYITQYDRSDCEPHFVKLRPRYNLACLVQQVPEAAGKQDAEKRALLDQAEAPLRAVDVTQGVPTAAEFGKHTTLDCSQLEALFRIVGKELAIIQGPPGTGKTFTSVSALKVILANRAPGRPPVIVAAQTNHALDQLLVLLQAQGAGIMRLGGRTENEQIKPRTLFNLKSLRRGGDHKTRQLVKEQNRNNDILQELINNNFRSDLLDAERLKAAGVISEAQFQSLTSDEWVSGSATESPLDTWLGESRVPTVYNDGTYDDYLDAPYEEVDDRGQGHEAEPDIDGAGVEDDEDDRLRGLYLDFRTIWTGKTPITGRWHVKCKQAMKEADLWKIPANLRGGVYQLWQTALRAARAEDIRRLLRRGAELGLQIKAATRIKDLDVIRENRIEIVGCTTTGLTKYRGFLNAMNPTIMLVEEAAETREANVTSALFPCLQQLILVGDHQQLAPRCDIQILEDPRYNLDVSLFERMVVNKVPFTMLNQQRRMAPALRRIVNQFYPKLKDHPSVADIAHRPHIPGMGDRRGFFFTHNWPEDVDHDGSKYNLREAEMIVGFVRYLLNNNVPSQSVTILTYYNGQKDTVRRMLRKMTGQVFNVVTVDSFQGEENDIILLSLVRSPKQEGAWNVGFLDNQNRATVAISRARRGFFLFGDKHNLLKCNQDSYELWARVWNGFASQGMVGMGKGLPIKCQQHGNEVWIQTPEDWTNNAGGCNLPCEGERSCGHKCDLLCHFHPHDQLSCLKPCERALEVCGHRCAGHCSDPCRCIKDCIRFQQMNPHAGYTVAQLEEEENDNDSDCVVEGDKTKIGDIMDDFRLVTMDERGKRRLSPTKKQAKNGDEVSRKNVSRKEVEMVKPTFGFAAEVLAGEPWDPEEHSKKDEVKVVIEPIAASPDDLISF